jgi:hypothetical protein
VSIPLCCVYFKESCLVQVKNQPTKKNTWVLPLLLLHLPIPWSSYPSMNWGECHWARDGLSGNSLASHAQNTFHKTPSTGKKKSVCVCHWHEVEKSSNPLCYSTESKDHLDMDKQREFSLAIDQPLKWQEDCRACTELCTEFSALPELHGRIYKAARYKIFLKGPIWVSYLKDGIF